MFEWYHFAIAASFLWAVTNIIGKYSLSKINRETTITAAIFGGLLVSIPIMIFYPISFSFIAIVSGVIWFIATYFYFYGLFESEVSKAVTLFLSIPVFVAIISAIFLNEHLSLIKYFGILLTVISAIMLSIEDNGKDEKLADNARHGLKISRGAIYMLLSSFFFAVSDTLSKVASMSIDPISVFFWVQFVSGFVGIAVVFIWRKKIDFISKRIIILCTVNDIISGTGSYLFIVAYTLTFVSLVTALETVQPVFVLLLALVITKLKPEWINEKIDKKAVLKKVVALAIFIIGVLLVVT